MARQLIADQLISATTTTNNLDLTGITVPWVVLLWQFELSSGSGSNYLTITGKVAANWEDDTASEVTFDLDHVSQWVSPRVVDDTMISAASGSKYKVTTVMRRVFDRVRIGFTYAGGGTRVFKVNLWTR